MKQTPYCDSEESELASGSDDEKKTVQQHRQKS
jgi:hypothetical protein